MASIISIMLREQIRLTKPILTRLSIAADRAAQDQVGALGSKVLAGRVCTEQVPFDLFEAAFVKPHHMHKRDGVILYLHGGGYTAGTLPYALGFGSVLADQTGLGVLCVAYRLAPETAFPGALEDALEAYRWLLARGYQPEKIRLVGESAGGGLCFCLLHALREKKMPFPGQVVGLSPWTDLTLSGASCTENQKKDPALTVEELGGYASMYGGPAEALRNPLISPIFGDFTDYPPALLFAGSEEILRDDAVRLAQRYQDCHSPCTLHVEDGLWHVYVLFPIPEATEAMKQICNFLRGKALDASNLKHQNKHRNRSIQF